MSYRTSTPRTSISSLPSRRESTISIQSGGQPQSMRLCSDPAGAIVHRRSSGITMSPRAKVTFSPILEHKDEQTIDISQRKETSTVDQEKEIAKAGQKKKIAIAAQDEETTNIDQDDGKITSVDQEETTTNTTNTTNTTTDINVDEDEKLSNE